MNGKQIRLRRLSANNRYLIVPMDHGVTTDDIGPLSDFLQTAGEIINGGATAIIVHKGMVCHLPVLNDVGLIVHMSASTELYNEVKKVLVCSVKEAISLGADAVSVHVNLGNDYEKEMLEDFSKVSSDCRTYQIPLLAMMYIRDNNNKDISTPQDIRHAIRIATELGADIVKISAKCDSETLSEIVKDSLIPVVVAGGEIKEKEAFLCRTEQYMKSGIDGICYGRNVFFSNKIKNFLFDLKKVVI